MKSLQASGLLSLLLLAAETSAQGYNSHAARGETGVDDLSCDSRDADAQLYPRFFSLLRGGRPGRFPGRSRNRSPLSAVGGEGGNKQSTTYSFENAKIGDNAKLDMGVQNQAKGGAVQKGGKKRRSLDSLELYTRDFDDEGTYFVSRDASEEGGNSIEQYVSFEGEDLLQNGGTLKIGTKNVQSGGNVYAREAGGLLNLFGGGDSKGGSSKTQGGNKVSNYHDFSRTAFGAGTIIDASNQNHQTGGNTRGAKGGNSGDGGKGGSLKMKLPPMVMKRKRSLAQQHVGQKPPYSRNTLSAPDVLQVRDAWMLELESREAEAEAEAEFEDDELWARDAEAEPDPEAEVFDYEEM